MIPELTVLTVIILYTGLFFGRLFAPEAGIYATHEIGINDIWDLNFPYKFILSEALKSNRLPVWNPQIGSGFPVLGEGQTGIFNLNNLLLFRIFSPVTAFNLGLAVSFAICAVGMYIFSRRIGISRSAALLAAIPYSFSGFFVTHISHFVLLQSAGYLPLVMVGSDLLMRGEKLTGFLVTAFFLSQQLFGGFSQMSFITILFACSYALYLVMTKSSNFKRLFLLFAAISFSFLLSAVQILPTEELSRISQRGKGLSVTDLLLYKYPLNNFITFLKPFALGDPQIGTYPHFQDNGGSLFWETSGYLGIIPIILFFLSPLFFGKIKYFWFWILAAGTSMMLMIGTQGPLYLLLLLPPFSLFRFPSRFLLVFTFTIATVSALTLDRLLRNIRIKNKISIMIFVIAAIDIFSVWGYYHPVIPYRNFISPPESVRELRRLSAERIFVYKTTARMFDEFESSQSGKIARYLSYRNDLVPNSNTLWGISSVDFYPSHYPQRLSYVSHLFGNQYQAESLLETALAPDLLKMLDIKSVSHILSPVPLTNSQLRLKSKLSLPNLVNQKLFIYENQDRLPFITAYEDVRYSKTLEKFAEMFAAADFDERRTAIIEDENIRFASAAAQLQFKYNLIQKKDTFISFDVELSRNALISVSQTYYPGWTAYIDNQKSRIIPVNLVNQGFPVPAGRHRIKLKYEPWSLYTGFFISGLSYSILLLLLILRIRRTRIPHAH